MAILVDQRWIGPHGIGRFAAEVTARIPCWEPVAEERSPVSPWDPLRLSLELRRRRPRLFFSPGFNAPLAAPVPFIFTIHDLNHLHFRENSNRLKRAYYAGIIRPACRKAKKVLTVSEFSRRTILEWSGAEANQVVNVGNGVDARFRPDGPRHDPGFPYLFYIGNRKPHKNLRRLLSAFFRSGAAARCKLLFSGAVDAELAAFASDHGIGERIAFAGDIAEARLPDYYRGAAALVFPSLYEGFGLPVIEAMACGTPVITSNVTSLPEVAGEAALLVDPLEVDHIAAAIDRVVNDAELRRELAEQGLRQAARYSWDATGERILRILAPYLEADNGAR